jgi:DNA modification methylase
MGSGSTGVASIKLKRQFKGFELDDEYFKICEKRLEIADNQVLYSNKIDLQKLNELNH